MTNPESKLWIPGQRLDSQYPDSTGQQLTEHWNEYSGREDSIALEGIYGVMSPPRREIKAVAVIDLCEVVRDTVTGFHEAMTSVKGIPKNCLYAENTWLKDVEHFNQADFVTDVVRVLMDSGNIAPVEGSDDIGDIMRSWRRGGVYVVADTSTLPGCEKGTIKYTMGRDYPGAFDALILPRNHDGKGKTSKADALNYLAHEAQISLANLPILVIDDAPHHLTAFKYAFYAHTQLALMAPSYQYNDNIDEKIGVLRYDTPFDTFNAGDKFLKGEGVAV